MLSKPELRICLVTSTFAPLIGGAETYALTFAEGMSDLGHAVTVVTDGWTRNSRSEQDPGAFDATLPFSVVRLAEYRQLIDSEDVIPWEALAFGLLPELERALASMEFDVVVTNSLDAAYTGKVLSIARGIPWAAAFHEQTPEAEPLGHARLTLVYRVLHPDLILAGSEFYTARAVAHGRSGDTVCIAHGIDTDRFRPGIDRETARRKRNIRQNATVLLCAARLTPRKGIDNLIHAFARLAHRWGDAHLLIAGTVNSSSRAYAMFLRDEVSRAGLEERVTFDERARSSDMPSLFAAADFVVQPSHSEGLGLATLEAMSAGKAVITTDIPPTHEISKGKDVLIICPPGDIERLANAIDDLLAHPKRCAELGVSSRRHVMHWFSQKDMLRQTEQALLDLVHKPKARD